ncbi:MAG: NADPH:quinone reductase [Rhodospirillales bacterium]|jgi:NADPH2:quinone reductase|nr:NADPH:quinone reductase [Rhodospirillales bacterium]
MRALWYEKVGPAAEVLTAGEMTTPTPQAGEVLVRVHASGVNPVDVKLRKGLRPLGEGERVVPHFDGAGTIEAAGAGIGEDRIGERVWVYEAQWQRTNGTAAEYISLPAHLAVPLPDVADFAGAACLGIPAMTAHRCVFADGPVSGQTVLVTGGAGAVSGYAIQFAKLGGAKVVATVSSPAKAEVAKAAGADEVLNYTTDDVAARVMELTADAGVERIVEVALGANFAITASVVANNGVVAAYASDAEPEPALPFRTLLYKNATLRNVLVFGIPGSAKAGAIADITRWLADGSLRNAVGQRFPLDQAAKAHEAVEEGSLGNVVVEIGD